MMVMGMVVGMGMGVVMLRVSMGVFGHGSRCSSCGGVQAGGVAWCRRGYIPYVGMRIRGSCNKDIRSFSCDWNENTRGEPGASTTAAPGAGHHRQCKQKPAQ